MSAPVVVMYVRAWCPYCARACELLTQKGVLFEQIDIGEQPEKGAQMIERTGRRTVPQIFFGDEAIGGYDDLAALDKAGRLREKLAG